MLNFLTIYSDCRRKITEDLIQRLNTRCGGKLTCGFYIDTKEVDDNTGAPYFRSVYIVCIEVKNDDIEISYRAEDRLYTDSIELFSMDEIFSILSCIKYEIYR